MIMRLGFSVVVLVYCIGVGCCGVINDSRQSLMQDNGKGITEKVSQSQNIFGSSVLGATAATPVQAKRRDFRLQLGQTLCANCRATHQCRVLNKCDSCKNWCNGTPAPAEPSAATDATSGNVVGSPNPPDSKSQTQNAEDSPKVSLASRFGDDEDSDVRRKHTVATMRRGKLKEDICKLLSISDISDIDTVGIWMTTHSNQPPTLTEHEAPEADKQTIELNQELSRVLEKEGNALSKDEIDEIVKKIVEQAKKERNISPGKSRSHTDDEYASPYTNDINNEDFNIPPTSFNPAVIQATPNMYLGAEQEGAAVATEPRVGQFNEDVSPVPDKTQTSDQMIGDPTPEIDDVEDAKPASDELENANKVMNDTSQKTDDDITGLPKQDEESIPGAAEHRTDDTVDEKLRTVKLIKKIKDKKAQKAQGAPASQVYPQPQPYRANDDPEDITGNVHSGESTDPEEKPMIDRLGTAKLIQKIKDKKAQQKQGPNQNAQTYYRANEDDVIGDQNIEEKMSVDKPQTEDATQADEAEKVPEILSVDLDNTPKLRSDDQEKVGRSNDENIEPASKLEDNAVDSVKNDVISDTKTIDKDIVEIPDGTTQQAGLSDDPSPSGGDPIAALRERTNALRDKIKEKIAAQKKLPSGPRYTAGEDQVGEPNIQGEEVPSPQPTPTEKTASKDKVGEKEPDMHTESDHNAQEPINVQRPLPNALGRFDEAKSVLEDVEDLVDKLQKKSNIQKIGLLGESQPTETASPKPPSENSDLGDGDLEESPKIMEGQKEREIIVQPSQFISDEEKVGTQPQENEIQDGYVVYHPKLITPSQITDKEETKIDHKEQDHVGTPAQETGGSEHVNQKTQDPLVPISINNDAMRPIKDEGRDTVGAEGPREQAIMPGMSTRGQFSESGSAEHPSWSSSLGKIIPAEDDRSIAMVQPKDIYFIGNGIKLPLHMVQNDDGAVHLSVDLDRLCSCKNHTCPKNHTAIETTVGTILEKEAELQDQLADTDAATNENFRDSPKSNGISSTDREELIHRSEREVVEGKGSEQTRSIFKRSINEAEPAENVITKTDAKELNKGKINEPIAAYTPKSRDVESKPTTESFTNNDHIKNEEINKPSSGNDSSVKSPSFLFNQLVNKKLEEVKAKMAEMEKKNELQKKQQAFSQDMLKTWLNWMNKQLIPAKKDSKPVSDLVDKTGDLISKPTADKSQSMGKPLLFPNPVKFNDILRKYNKGSELFDDVLPIYKNVFQFKGDSHNKLGNINDVAKDGGEKIKTKSPMPKVITLGDAVLKKQADIMNNALTWMKDFAVLDKDIRK